MTTMQFAGTFNNLQTYCQGMNAAKPENGISSEELAALKAEIKEKHPALSVEGDVYASPANLTIAHPVAGQNSNQVQQADKFVQDRLGKQGVKFNYEA